MTERPYTIGLYLLRCSELGLHPSELEQFTLGDIDDMLIERGNDAEKWRYIATQEDFDRF